MTNSAPMPLHIIISGLTAAGKTTHARLLARRLGYEYFSSSALLAQLAGSQAEHWTPALDCIRQKNSKLDSEVDRLALRRFANPKPCVFDAWALPWLLRSQEAICIWIESDVKSRERKCQVSAVQHRRFDELYRCGEVISEKDGLSRNLFRHLYGFDLYVDRTPFDWIIDNSHLIPMATEECSIRGIAVFERAFEVIVISEILSTQMAIPLGVRECFVKWPPKFDTFFLPNA